MIGRDIAELFPWYVNGTLGGRERQRVEGHVRECSRCRDELAKERRIYEAMTIEPNVVYMPAPSLKRLQAAIRDPDTDQTPSRSPKARRLVPGPGLAAASIVVAAAMLVTLAAHRREHSRGPDYHTAAMSTVQAQEEIIRAVFAPTMTLEDLQGILAQAQLRIISGPTEAGVYSLAAMSPRPMSASLALLRSHPEVRFAESAQSEEPLGSRDGLLRGSL
jgi:anti-sigma factor RsiW